MPRLSHYALFLMAAAAALSLTVAPAAQRPQFNNTVRGFIKVDAPVIALTNVRVIESVKGRVGIW